MGGVILRRNRMCRNPTLALLHLRRALCVAALILALGTTTRTAAAEASFDPGLWTTFKARYLFQGRILDRQSQAGMLTDRTHTEAQGWAMLLAVAADDRAAFDEIWTWTKATLQRSDGLFSWGYDSAVAPNGAATATGRVIDQNNASDGDLYLAWALARADGHWPGHGYGAAASALAQSILRLLVVRQDDAAYLLPWHDGYEALLAASHAAATLPAGSRFFLNPSYYVYPAFRELDQVQPDPRWQALTTTGLALLESARFGRFGLPANFVEMTLRQDGTLLPGLTDNNGHDPSWPYYGFDAVRVPLYLAWGGLMTSERRSIFETFWQIYPDIACVPAALDLVSGKATNYPLSDGGRAILALARGSDDPAKIAFLLPAHPTGSTPNDYYGEILMLLTRLAAADLQAAR